MISRAALMGLVVFLVGVLTVSIWTAANATTTTLNIGGATIQIEIEDGPFDLPPEKILGWIRAAATAVTGYYGKFPVPTLQLRVRATDGDNVHSGKTFPKDDGGYISIAVGRSISEATLRDDWMLTHEMVHLAFPDMSENHHWIEEGLATYVEPWARVQAGALTPQKVWGDVVRDMPKGLPQSGDRGLDHTPTWGRTYWGGALFCLLADVRIRERTHGQEGLRDALRAIDREHNISDEMEITDAFAIGDDAVGVPVLSELYRQMASDPAPVDLNALWKQLGVRPGANGISFDDDAPLAAVRRGIEKG
jgi:hypothetical protein